ncbi:hypothetical protein HMPREF1548_00714 [Clostridium sp. KLE 1755]|uniref:Uncharacterized protein n=1 Tax=Eisenbergiella massiliensis TaxID=1720294 RepID=A0A3E3I1M9_9FIRM|nr:hypothetical protein HMPREF1548_00714 [Clostridium sp. KLE 1755]RGE58441.1 hypothetical protein DWY69_31090 [Eisenbergiella massiliensis]
MDHGRIFQGHNKKTEEACGTPGSPGASVQDYCPERRPAVFAHNVHFFYIHRLFLLFTLLPIIKSSKYSAVIKSFFQPERPIESAFPLCSIHFCKGKMVPRQTNRVMGGSMK